MGKAQILKVEKEMALPQPRNGLATHCALALAVSAALSVGSPAPIQAGIDLEQIELSSLDGSNGFSLPGEAQNDRSGRSVSAAGDINGDGIDDLIIGAFLADPNGNASGRSYVVFGSDAGFSSSFDLSTLDGSNGFVLDGEAEEDRSGWSVSAAGDINGDSIDDLIIGAIFASPNGKTSGRSYVVFGSDSEFPSPFDLATLNGSNGFALNGEAPGDEAGTSVSAAGDINGDGLDDLIIGASLADPNGDDSGRSYVVFGSTIAFPNPFELSTLDGSNGFALNGEAAYDYAGASVSAAGDINGDGIDDLIIGAFFADPNGNNSGRSYVVFGSDGGFSSSFDLSTLNGVNGFALNGESANDRSGESVAAAGDINDDGIDDLIIGASRANKAYVVFGSQSAFPSSLELSMLDGSNGVVFEGEEALDRFGISVSGAGDINDDGIDDLIIGAEAASPNGGRSGRSYVLLGSSSGFDSPIMMAGVNGLDGFVVNGEQLGDEAGAAVSAAGDINGDGINDLIIGADGADPGGNSYVVFGRRGDRLFRDRFEGE